MSAHFQPRGQPCRRVCAFQPCLSSSAPSRLTLTRPDIRDLLFAGVSLLLPRRKPEASPRGGQAACSALSPLCFESQTPWGPSVPASKWVRFCCDPQLAFLFLCPGGSRPRTFFIKASNRGPARDKPSAKQQRLRASNRGVPAESLQRKDTQTRKLDRPHSRGPAVQPPGPLFPRSRWLPGRRARAQGAVRSLPPDAEARLGLWGERTLEVGGTGVSRRRSKVMPRPRGAVTLCQDQATRQ